MLKIGIISNTPRVGKTTMMLSLAHTYSRSQQAKVAIFSTGELSHVTEPLMDTQEKDEAATAGVFKAMLETQTIRGEQLFSYAVRSGYDEVFIFDLFDRKDDKNQNFDFLARTIGSIDAKMVLVEIVGDPASTENKSIVDRCDVLLYLFNADRYSINQLRLYAKALPAKDKDKVFYVCAKFDPWIMADKKLSGLVGKGTKDFMLFDYNPAITKMFIDGIYSKFADAIVYGHEDFLKTRQQLLTIMQKLYDEPGRKRIKEIKDWPKK